MYASDCWETCFAESERGTEHAEYEQVIGLLQSFKKALQTDANTGSGASNGNLLIDFLYVLYDSKMILFRSKNHCNIFVPNDKFQLELTNLKLIKLPRRSYMAIGKV